MDLERKITKLKCWEVSEMITAICGVLGFAWEEANEFDPLCGHDTHSLYKTRTFEISEHSYSNYYGNSGPHQEVIYKGKLVFRTGKKDYRRSGDWEKQFERLYSRAVNLVN